jgi:hypothetical protein
MGLGHVLRQDERPRQKVKGEKWALVARLRLVL